MRARASARSIPERRRPSSAPASSAAPSPSRDAVQRSASRARARLANFRRPTSSSGSTSNFRATAAAIRSKATDPARGRDPAGPTRARRCAARRGRRGRRAQALDRILGELPAGDRCQVSAADRGACARREQHESAEEERRRARRDATDILRSVARRDDGRPLALDPLGDPMAQVFPRRRRPREAMEFVDHQQIAGAGRRREVGDAARLDRLAQPRGPFAHRSAEHRSAALEYQFLQLLDEARLSRVGGPTSTSGPARSRAPAATRWIAVTQARFPSSTKSGVARRAVEAADGRRRFNASAPSQGVP